MSMIRVEGKPRDILGYAPDGKALAVLDLQVSDTSMLPAKNGVVGPYKVQPGSNAQIIELGKIATLNENGIWYTFGTGDVIQTGGGGE